ncbi:unnamed protein product [Camellia sinensis]
MDDYLWHLERYFEALNLNDELAKVRTASLYLTKLAGVWWRRKHAEMERGICTISSWEQFKNELTRQFYPENVAYEARLKMRELKHTHSIRDYVQEFSGLMLQIPNMSDDDLLFNFTAGLKQWAQLELQRRGVKDISTALTMAETLVEYTKPEASNLESTKEGQGKGGGATWAKEWEDSKAPRYKEGRSKSPTGKDWRKEAKKENKPKDNCFICDGPHWARDCPKRKSLSAMLEREERDEQACMGSLQLLGAIEAKPTASTHGDKGLMYVEGKINGKAAQVMVDTGASHNFIKAEEAKRLGLRLDRGQALMKTVNAKAKPVDGMARGVELHLGGWRRKVNFSIASLDDYDVVLGMEFLREFNVAMLPRDNKMCIMEGGPYMVPMVSKENTKLQLLSAIELGADNDKVEGATKKMINRQAAKKVLSTTQVKDDSKKGETTYQVILQGKRGVRPKRLPPRGKVDRKKKKKQGAKTPYQAQMARATPYGKEATKALQERRDEGVAAIGGGECHGQRNPNAALTRKRWKLKEIARTL